MTAFMGWLGLNDVVYLEDRDDIEAILVRCSWCPWFTDAADIWDANNCVIDHQNEHGIYSDPDTGELYYDPEEDSVPRDHRYQIDDVTIEPGGPVTGLVFGLAIVFVLYAIVGLIAWGVLK